MADMADFKKVCAHLQSSSADVAAGRADRAAQLQDQTQILQLRATVRLGIQGGQSRAEEIGEERKKLDAKTVRLSALSYERQTIAREIARNKAFVSRHGEVDLADATEAVAAGASNEHQAMLARLTYELQQRKKLKTSNEELGRKKASLAQSVSKKRKYTDTLPGTVAGLVDAARPLLAAFDSGDSASPEGKSDLPPAVYVLVSQLQAHRESFQPEMDITIKGSAVDLKVTKSDGSVLTLAFQHLRAHNVITVDGSLKPKSGKPMSGPALLSALYPMDDGLCNPNPAAVLACKKVGWDARRSDRPYYWAQALAGLHFPKPEAASKTPAVHQPCTLEQVLGRILNSA